MKVFLVKLLAFSLLFYASYLGLVHLLAQSDVDEHYYKFTQEAGGLILGISRAGEGINPYVLDQELDRYLGQIPMVNFALNKYQSPYGKIYLEAVRRKMGNRSGGIFILSIAPGNFTAPGFLNEKEIVAMDEQMSIGKIKELNQSPNLDYIINCYSKPLYSAFELKASENPVFHPNGWQEAKLVSPGFTITPELTQHWKTLNIREYKRIIKREKISEYRIRQFALTLQHLTTIGEVFVVRMPTDCDILADEDEFWPHFKQEFSRITAEVNVPFFDYSDECTNYLYYDGSHLASEDASRFTRQLASDIDQHLKLSTRHAVQGE